MKIVMYVCAVLASSFAAHVNAGLISFEEFGQQSGAFSNEPPLDSQYAAQGVNFSGGWEILNESGSFGVDARSGDHFAAYNTNVSGITDTLTMTFDNTISQASAFLGDGSSTSWTITAFLAGVQVSQLNLVNPASGYVEFVFNSISFDQITVQGSSNAAVLDDLSFQMVSVPNPATLALISLGLVGINIARRKHK